MITNKDNVVKAWKEGKAARTKNRSFSTDGEYLYSYSLLIGIRLKSGYTIVGDYTRQAQGNHYRSKTTSTHVNLASRSAHAVWHPLVFENSPGIVENITDIPF